MINLKKLVQPDKIKKTFGYIPAIRPYRWNILSTSVLEHWKVFRLPTNTREFTACGSWEFVWLPTLLIFIAHVISYCRILISLQENVNTNITNANRSTQVKILLLGIPVHESDGWCIDNEIGIWNGGVVLRWSEETK